MAKWKPAGRVIHVDPAILRMYRFEYDRTFERLAMYEYPVLRETPRGVWLDLGFGYKKFVLKRARKRFAYPTIEEAIESFRARKRAQIRLCQATITRAEAALEAMRHYRGEDDVQER